MGQGCVPAQGVAIARVGAIVALALGLSNCGQSKVDPKYGVSASRRVIEPGEPVPKGGGTYRVGKPYQVAGRTYVPQEDPNYDAEGMASWYGDAFHGRQTANGEVFDMNSVSAAHPTLPIPSYVRVTNLRNKRSLIVRVNDRGPYHENRVIDVSVRAAKLLGFHQFGVSRVRVEWVGRAALEGSDDEKLAATLHQGSQGPATLVASAKPQKRYQPEYFDPRPTTPAASAVAVRQEPQPVRTASRTTSTNAETIGRAAPAPVYASASQRSQPVPQSALAGPQTSFDSRFAPIASAPIPPAGAAPVSAFAPRFDSVITGRGIY